MDVSLIMRVRLCSSCVQSSVLHGTETLPVRKENKVAFQRAEMRMVRWMCDVKVNDRVPSKELRDDITSKNRLQWYGHVLQKVDNDLMKKYYIWSMKWRVPDQEVDQKGLGEKLCKKTVKHIN